MRGRKRKLPADFAPLTWATSEEEEEQQPGETHERLEDHRAPGASDNLEEDEPFLSDHGSQFADELPEQEEDGVGPYDPLAQDVDLGEVGDYEPHNPLVPDVDADLPDVDEVQGDANVQGQEADDEDVAQEEDHDVPNDEHPDDGDGDEPQPEGDPIHYNDILEALSRDWILLELKHVVSKSAANEFWDAAARYFPILQQCRENENITKKIPKFRSIRNNLYNDNVPGIKLEVAYEVRETRDIIVMEDLNSTPLSRFPPSKYIKLYEVSTVKVSITIFLLILVPIAGLQN